MKLTTYISASVFIFMSAVIIRNNEAKTQSDALYETRWSLRKIHTPLETIDINGKAFIRFDEEKKSAGGNGGCNSFGSTAEISGNTLHITNIFSTKMYCEGIQEQENNYLDYLSKVNRFEIKGGTLQLYRDKVLMLEFVE